jgi:hypothetical protein
MLQKAAEALAAGHKRMIDVCKTDDGYFLNFWGIGPRQNADSGPVIKLADAVDALMHSAVSA